LVKTLTVKKNLVKTIFGPKIFSKKNCVKKIVGQKLIFDKNKFGVKNNFWSKKVWSKLINDEKKLMKKKICQKLLVLENVYSKIILVQNFFVPKKF